MNEVKRTLRQGVREDIMLADFKVRVVKRFKKTCVKICRDDVPSPPDAMAKPIGDRSAPAPDLQAVPTFPYAKRLKMPNGAGISPCLDAAESLPCLFPCIVERVFPHLGLK